MTLFLVWTLNRPCTHHEVQGGSTCVPMQGQAQISKYEAGMVDCFLYMNMQQDVDYLS